MECGNPRQELLTDDKDRLVEVSVEYEVSGGTTDAIDLKETRSISISTLMDQPSNDNEKPLLDVLPLSKKKIMLTAPSGNRSLSVSSKNSAEQDTAETPSFLKTLQLRKLPTVTLATKMRRGLATQGSVIRTYISKRLGSDQTLLITGLFHNTGRRCTQKHIVVDQPSTKVDGQHSRKRSMWKDAETYNTKLDIVTSKGRATKSPFASSKPLARVKELEGADSAAQPISELGINVNVVNVPVILGLEANGRRNTHLKSPCPIKGEALLDLMQDGKNNSCPSNGDKNMGHEKQKGRGSGQKRKRGRPTRFVVKNPEIVKAGIEGKGVPCVGDDMSIVLKDNADGVESLRETEHNSADAREVPCEKSENGVGISGALTHEADDDQPLSMWCLHPNPTNTEVSKISSEPLANGGNDEADRQVIATVDCHAVSIEQNGVEGEDGRQPFQKKSLIWKTIESMEVFQLMPQDPHFRPLMKCKDEHREGSAIGFMVTFASLYDKVSSLRYDDPRSIYESILETLLDLEKHGFDTAILKNRLTDLLLIRDKQGGPLIESLDTEKLIAEQVSERKVLAEKIEGIQQQMAKLQEEYAVSESKVQAIDMEISKLQSEVDSARARINDARHNFEQLVNAPWKLP